MGEHEACTARVGGWRAAAWFEGQLFPMEAALDRDVERVSSLDTYTVTVHTDDETRSVSCRPSDAVHDAIAAAFEHPVERVNEVVLGDDAVQPGDTFDDWGIEASTATLLAQP